jgi:hypothetical protein
MQVYLDRRAEIGRTSRQLKPEPTNQLERQTITSEHEKSDPTSSVNLTRQFIMDQIVACTPPDASNSNPPPNYPWVFTASHTKFLGAAPVAVFLACKAAALSVFHVRTFASQNEAAE